MIKRSEILCIIINFNGQEDTMECCESLICGSTVPDILLVDNASGYFNRAIFEKYDNVEIIENKINLGFAEANNVGVNYGINHDYKYVLLLNNDTLVEAKMVEELAKSIDDNIIVAPKILRHQTNEIWYAGGYIDFIRGGAYHRIKEYKSKKNTFASGCCMLIPIDLLKRIQLFDDKLFMYCEDFDFCIRCLKIGVKIKYQDKAVLWHKVGASSGGEKSPRSIYYANRNRFFIINKYDFPFVAKVFMYFSKLIQYFYFKGEKKMALKKAYLDYKRNNFGKRFE